MSAAGGGCGCGGPVSPGGCGCCQGIEPTTPQSTINPPGLDSLDYRAGTHGSFLATMLARLSSPGYLELHPLAARTPDDPAIALLDAWATVGDVLTFYQERIANEGFLRTATERHSILELARLVAYELRPGIAAGAHLAYTVDKDLKGNHTVVAIPRGSRAMSVPGPDDGLPQTFETAEELEAGSAWNNLEPRLWRPVDLVASRAGELGVLYFDSVSTDLKPGDVVLLVFGRRGDRRVPLKVASVATEQIVPDPPGPPTPRTVVTFQQPSRAGLTAAVAALRSALSQQGGLRDLAKAGLAASSGAARADTEVLEPLAELLDQHPDAGELATKIGSGMISLRERLALADVAGHELLERWLGRTAGTLERVLHGLRASGRGASPVASAPPGAGPPAGSGVAGVASPVRQGGSPTAPLGGLVAALSRRPPVQPATAKELERSPTALFGEGSDLGPRLLASFAPQAAGTLYEAWAAAEVAVPSRLQSVQAMRVKAAPFGAAAPQRPTSDSAGNITTDEWPLREPAVLGVRVGLVSDEFRRMALSAEVDGQTSAVERQATSVSRIALRPGFASVSVSETRMMVRFGGALPRVGVTIKPTEGGLEVRLTDDKGRVWRPRPGEVLRHTKNGHRITVSLLPSQALDGRTEIAVSDEVLRPPSPRNVLPLDAQYDQIVPGGWVVVDWGGSGRPTVVGRVTRVETVSKTAYNISAKVTQLTLSDGWLEPTDLLLSAVRDATVYAQSEPLELASEPVDDDIGGTTIELGSLYQGLEAGRWIVVEGERTDIPGTTGVRDAEVAMLAGIVQSADTDLPGELVHTTLQLARPLGFTYRRSTVKIWGNVVKATHGESHVEVLGSGDAKQPFQEFLLRQSPVTHLAAASPLGAEGALEARVDQVLWRRADHLALLGPRDRAFVTRTAEDDTTTLVFGDGRNGARLPTGVENVRTEYRTGLGQSGNVRAGQITQMQTRPLSVSGVVNPVRASGGADRDTLEQARRNAPLAVQALDRLVSVEDYEDFARARAGIGKASARALSDGSRRVVHVTIAGAGDVPIDPSSDLLLALRRSLSEWGDPSEPFAIAVRELVLLVVSANVEVHPDHRWADVEPRLRATLLDSFGFDRRELGQSVGLSEVQAAMHGVRGVVAVDIDALDGVPESITPEQLQTLPERLKPPPLTRVVAEHARFVRERHTVKDGETLTEVASLAGIGLAELIRLNPLLVARGSAVAAGTELVVRLGIRPAQLALLSGVIPDTLILREVRP